MARGILGPDKWLCVEQKVMLATDPCKARDAAREHMAAFLVKVNYRNAWLRMGFSEGDITTGAATALLTPWLPGEMNRPSGSGSRNIGMPEQATFASRPSTQRRRLSPTSTP